MNKNPKEVFLNILTAIDYAEDKEAFANQFFGLCGKQALADLVQTLPKDKQTELESSLSSQKDPAVIRSTLLSYFDQTHMDDALKAAAEKTVKSYLQAILLTLSTEQKEKLQTYLRSFAEEYITSLTAG